MHTCSILSVHPGAASLNRPQPDLQRAVHTFKIAIAWLCFQHGVVYRPAARSSASVANMSVLPVVVAVTETVMAMCRHAHWPRPLLPSATLSWGTILHNCGFSSFSKNSMVKLVLYSCVHVCWNTPSCVLKLSLFCCGEAGCQGGRCLYKRAFSAPAHGYT